MGVGLKADVALEVVHGVDVIHPRGVHVTEQDGALHLAESLGGEQLLSLADAVLGAGNEHIRHVLGGEGLQLLLGVGKVLLGAEVAHEVGAQACEVPLGGGALGGMGGHGGLDVAADHIHHGIRQVGVVQHRLALTVDDGSLLVHDVVVGQDVLTALEVVILDLLLGVLDGVGQDTRLDGGIVVQTHAVDEGDDALVVTEQAHEVVLQGQEEAGLTGVALSSRAAAELVVDTAGLVTLGAQDEEAAGGADALGLGGDLGLMLLVQLSVLAADAQDGLVGGIGGARSLHDQTLLNP